MALVYAGLLTPMALCPSIALSIGLPSLSVNAQLQGAIAIKASLTASPPTVSSALTVEGKIAAAIEAQITAPPVPPIPLVSFTATTMAGIVATFTAAPAALLSLEALLSAAAGIYSFGYTGLGTGLGAAMTTELATSWPDSIPSSGACNAIIIAATSPASPIPPSTLSQVQLTKLLSGLPFGAGLAYGGKIGLSALLPVVAAAAPEGGVTIAASLQASLAVQASLSIVPPTLVAQAASVAKFTAALSATASLKPPTAQIAAMASLIAKINANTPGSASLGAALGAGGSFYVYSYAGTGSGMGAAITTALTSTWGDGFTPTAQACTAAVLATTDSLSFAAMTGFFGGA